jgi:transposase
MAEPGQFGLTPSVQDTICRGIECGLYLEDAVRAAGVDPHTYRDWLEKAENEDGPHAAEYHAFKDAVDAAQAQYQLHYLGTVRAAAESGPKGWTAAAWLLERRFPHKWGLRNRTELTGLDGAPVKIVFEFIRPKAEIEDSQDQDS